MRDVVPVVGDADETQVAMLVEPVAAGLRGGQDPLHRVNGLLHDELGPDVHRGQFAPALVDLVDVDFVVDIHELQQMEQEQRDVGVGARGDIGHRRCPGDPRVQLAEVDLVGVEVDEHVHLEEAPVALLSQPVAEPAHMADRGAAVGLGEGLGEQVVAAPAATVGRQLGVAGQVGHERSHDRAMPGVDGLHGDGAVIDPLHDLQFLADHVLAVAVPLGFGGDEEGCFARVPVGCLDNQIRAQAGLCGKFVQLRVAVGAAQDVGHRGRAGLLAEAGGDDLGVQVAAQRVLRQDQLVVEFVADLLGLLVEEHHRDHRAGPGRRTPRLDEALNLGVAQQVIVDLLGAVELHIGLAGRGEHPGVRAVPRVVVDDVLETADPPIDAQQVEARRPDEEDRLLVGPEEGANLRDALQAAGSEDFRYHVRPLRPSAPVTGRILPCRRQR